MEQCKCCYSAVCLSVAVACRCCICKEGLYTLKLLYMHNAAHHPQDGAPLYLLRG